MSQIFVQDVADVIEWTAAAAITSSDFIDVGGKLGVALASAASGEKVSVRLVGVIKAAKGAEAFTAGQVVTADTGDNTVKGTGGDISAAGIVTEAAQSGDATVLVRLNG